MASGTKIRPLTRLLEASDAPLWIIEPNGRLVYLSGGCERWLGVAIESLVDRRAIAGAPVSEDPLDRLAASLSPPHGIGQRGTASLRLQPPAVGDSRPDPLEVRFVRVGTVDDGWTICVGGEFHDRAVDAELQDAVAIRQRLDAWRKRHANLATVATAGVSIAARQLRRRLQVAAATRTDIGFFGPLGCNSESIALRIHELSAPAEPLVTIDGPLMDPELLDAVLMPLVHQLNDVTQPQGTALVRDLTEMPYDAQHRLASMIHTFDGRLRLLALSRPRPRMLSEPAEGTELQTQFGIEAEKPSGICAALLEILSSLSVVIEPLSERVEDIPMLATAMLDSRHAAGKAVAERISRAALDALVIYPWPRDHDELREAIEHAARTATSPSVGVENLPLAIRSYRPGQTLESERNLVSLDDAVQRFELRLILEAVESADGNRAEAARRLGISRARLLRKIDDPKRENSDLDG